MELNFLYFSHNSFSISVTVPVPVLQVFPIGCHSDRLIDRAVLFWLGVWGREPLSLYVGLNPEVGEEEEEEHAIHPNEVDPEGNLVVALLHEVVLGDVNGHQNKLRLQNRSLLKL